MTERRRYEHILAIYPNARGFGFVLLEGGLSPLDWAAVEVRGENRNRECMRRIAALLGRSSPDVLVLEDTRTCEAASRRANRIRELIDAIIVFSETQSVPIFTYSRRQIQEAFRELGTPTKQRIAEAIAKNIPAFERYVPAMRKPWRSEDARMGLFDAAALAITHFKLSC